MKGIYLYNSTENPGRTEKIIERTNAINYHNKSIKDVENELDSVEGDFIYTTYTNYFKQLQPLSRLGIPVILATGDPWGRLFTDDLKEFVDYVGVNGIAVTCHNEIAAYKEYFKDNPLDIFWFKWGINDKYMKNYKEEKRRDVFYSGKLSNYQYRAELDYILSMGIKGIKYRRRGPAKHTNISYEDYAREVSRSWINLGGCIQSEDRCDYMGNNIEYTFAKTIEIPGCNSCLLNPHWYDEEVLGFRDGENCILFNNVKEAIYKIKYYLSNKEDLIKITKNGYNHIHNNYNYDKILDEFLDKVERRYG